MMKIKSIAYIAILFGAAVLTSCGGDDGGGAVIPPPTGGSDDGLYITGTATSETPSSAIEMDDAYVDAFGSTPPYSERPGLYEAYIYMEAGDFNITQIEEEVETVWGGTVTEEDLGSGKMWVSADFAVGGDAFSVTESGLYHVTIDVTSGTAYIVKINTYGLIGTAGPGWSSDAPMALKSADANTVVFEGTNIELKAGEFKFRYNENWNSDRSAATPAVDGLNLLTNFGTNTEGGDENGGFQPGGFNFNFTGNPGVYTVTLTFSPGKGYSAVAEFERTGDGSGFDPAEYNWGIIGAATDSAWDADVNFIYKGEDAGTHKWVAFVYLQDGEFKYRTNDAWDFELNPGNVDHTGDAASEVSEGGNFILDAATDSGYYYITITTADEGATWAVQFDAGVWGIIGAATPGGWDNSTPLAYNGDNSWSADVVMLADEYKFRANDSWDLNLGGDLNALTLDGANLVSTAGTFTVTVMTADHGATYTATLQ
ncbi:SusF/SusE family outer membrane protein [Hyphobacterium sp. CCMP332]|nr:SusF/SusE family outer membrane protein [Hyphobacterium sp. CCMP332]